MTKTYYLPIGSWPLNDQPYHKLFSSIEWQSTDVKDADVLVLPGGSDIGDRHDRDSVEFHLYSEWSLSGRPVVGICRGMQVMLHQNSGRLVTHIPDETTQIMHTTMTSYWRGQSSWHSTEAGLLTNSRHHQGFTTVPPGWEVLDKTSDGIIEAVRKDNQFAVQWHPEKTEMINTVALQWWVEQVKKIL
jgi:gamma-glutamyl-gamma-aminobutyrate hydrolase PuuD